MEETISNHHKYTNQRVGFVVWVRKRSSCTSTTGTVCTQWIQAKTNQRATEEHNFTPENVFCRWSIQPSLGIAYMGLSPKSGTPLKWRFFLHEPRYHFCCISSDIQRKYSNMFIHPHFQVVYFPILDRITYIRYTSSSTVSYHSPNCVGPILGPRPCSPTGQWLLPALLLWQKVQEKDVQREFRHT